ncbi:MAG: XisI protein [Acidobacteria bacterium]|nr:XisI protein [Acidobacteriota bacterium]
MDKSLNYREIIKSILSRYLEIDRQSPEEGIEYYLSCDDTNGHYIWGSIGWSKGRRARYVHAHLRIKNEKIWIETDLTEHGLANDLLENGVAKEDIVLAFQEPSMRRFNEFAVA